ncbi:hypothetical protein Pfo_010183 [Paulownia fortunei]|nr:hypothetical protein Pfo_010183 [Paulownia fortunei]
MIPFQIIYECRRTLREAGHFFEEDVILLDPEVLDEEEGETTEAGRVPGAAEAAKNFPGVHAGKGAPQGKEIE